MNHRNRILLYLLFSISCVAFATASTQIDAIALLGLTSLLASVFGGIGLGWVWHAACSRTRFASIAVILGISAFPVNMAIP